MEFENAESEYICYECKEITLLKAKNPIRCAHCGNNILYKRRDKDTVVQLKAI